MKKNGRLTDGWTDGRTDERTNGTPSYRDAKTHLKTPKTRWDAHLQTSRPIRKRHGVLANVTGDLRTSRGTRKRHGGLANVMADTG